MDEVLDHAGVAFFAFGRQSLYRWLVIVQGESALLWLISPNIFFDLPLQSELSTGVAGYRFTVPRRFIYEPSFHSQLICPTLRPEVRASGWQRFVARRGLRWPCSLTIRVYRCVCGSATSQLQPTPVSRPLLSGG